MASFDLFDSVAAQGAEIDANQDEIVSLSERVNELEEFEAASRTSTVLVSAARIVVDTRNVGYEVPGATSLPASTGDQEFEIEVSATGEVTATATFDTADLRAKTAVVRANEAIGSTNALQFTNGDNQYYIGIDSTGDWFFGTDTGDTYTIKITLTSIAVGGGGVDTAAVNALIRAGVYDWAEEGNMAPIPATKFTRASPARTGDDGVTNFHTINVNMARLIAPWAYKSSSDRIPGNKIPGAIHLHDGVLTGLSITNSSNNAETALSAFGVSFDLDDYAHGEFHSEITFTLQRASAANMGFDVGAPSLTVYRTDIVFRTTIGNTAVYVAGGALVNFVAGIGAILPSSAQS